MGRLGTLLRPESVAVVGANDDPATYGGRVWQFLRRDFRGPSMAVNRRPGAVGDATLAPSLRELPMVPEAIVIATPANAVFEVLEEASEIGVGAAVVLSRELLGAEAELRAIARRSGMTLLGPNCLGLINANAGVSLSSSISLEAPLRGGPLALIAQSGALMGTLHARAVEAGIGLGLCVSTGSQAVVRAEDLMLELAEDEEIEAVGVYVEDVDPPRFEEAVGALHARGAVVIVLKGGLTAPGSLITASHSGALASDGRAFGQLAAELGVVMVDEPGALLTTLAVSGGVRRRWFVATVSGGLSAVAVDQAVLAGIDLPEPLVEPLERVGVKPPFNPLDLDATASSEVEKAVVVAALARDEEADGVLVVINDMPGLDRFLKQLRTHADERIVLCSECSGQSAAALRDWVANGGSYTTGLAQTFGALGRLHPNRMPRANGERSPDDALLAPGDVLALLEEQSVPVLPFVEVRTTDEALRAADHLGYPVVVKIARAAHRGDGIRIGLRGPEEVSAAVDELSGSGLLLVQPHCSAGLELYVGVFPDPTFGLQLLIGAGGSCLEELADVAIVSADRLELGIENILGHTSVGRWLLAGVGRGLLGLDRLEATAKGALRAADALGSRLVSLDLNPVVVNDQGAIVVDAKVRVATASRAHAPSSRTEESRV
jgi:acetate---CoA ligase (ADP-forming)